MTKGLVFLVGQKDIIWDCWGAKEYTSPRQTLVVPVGRLPFRSCTGLEGSALTDRLLYSDWSAKGSIPFYPLRHAFMKI